MEQSRIVVDTLKTALHEQGLTYRELAARIDMSESSVKRMFSRHTFSLGRLEQVCQAVGLSLLELMQRARVQGAEQYQLTVRQERALIADMKLFYFFWMLVNRHQLSQIVRRFRLRKHEVSRYLVKLDKLGILTLRENQRFTLHVPANVTWTADGPITKILISRSLPRFLRKRFHDDEEFFQFLVVRLSRASLARFRSRIHRVAKEIFSQSMTEDAISGNSDTVGVALAIGRMEFSLKDVVD